jgi:hypothetical protein
MFHIDEFRFEDLREALRMKFATQRKLAGEKSELEFEKQVMPFLSLFPLLLHLECSESHSSDFKSIYILLIECISEKLLLISCRLQQQEAKLEKYKKEARTCKETLAILGEDAEEADAQAAMALCTSCHFFLICEYTHILSLSALICVREANQTDMCSKLTPI